MYHVIPSHDAPVHPGQMCHMRRGLRIRFYSSSAVGDAHGAQALPNADPGPALRVQRGQLHAAQSQHTSLENRIV
ncbi:hypothetical protein SKAU_G00048760 [Synaphobranchus kaupii]|uniref:Uncharacterized protein n=1 Tax=Synaphobranchus kaupii TaxID=118154 RepID=A0A9Q1J8F6_SYNKA|nr:hypothetical protein SKAU_G00048760 [Synaphobranchus kaupii]